MWLRLSEAEPFVRVDSNGVEIMYHQRSAFDGTRRSKAPRSSLSFPRRPEHRRRKVNVKRKLLRLIEILEEDHFVAFYSVVIVCIGIMGLYLGLFISSFSEDDANEYVRTRKSHQISTYEQHFPALTLSSYHIKNSRKYNDTVSKEHEICFVHIGKTAGSTVGCALGFGLHCQNLTSITPGLLPQYTTRLFHSDEYNCFDDSSYYLFVVRNPLDRLVSAFNYDRPADGNWETFLQQKPYLKRTNVTQLHLDCPFDSIDTLARFGLSQEGNVTDECKHRAGAFIDGTEYLGIHSYWNYQFHLEGVPSNARIMTIRQNNLVDDWNTIEHLIGGEEHILGPNQTVLLHQNKHIVASNNIRNDTTDVLVDEKFLSDKSRALLCERLCNEIQVYKKILHISVNLNEEQIRQSMEEVKKSCPTEAVATSCSMALPDITEKLISGRGYSSNVTLEVASHEITVGRVQLPINSTGF
jgi:hypothetical protein